MNKITYDAIKKNTDTSSRTTLAMFLPQYNKLKHDLEEINIDAVLNDISQLSDDVSVIIERLKEQSSELRTEAQDDNVNTGWLDVVDRILQGAEETTEQLDDITIEPEGCGECDECQTAESIDCNETGCDTIIDACGVTQADPCYAGETEEPIITCEANDEEITCESCDTGCDVCDASETSGCVVDSYVCDACDSGCQLNDASEVCVGNDACGSGQGSCGACDNIDDDNCTTHNASGNCYYLNETGDCVSYNDSGDCTSSNSTGDCQSNNTGGGNCSMNNQEGERIGCNYSNETGDCQFSNTSGDCASSNDAGNCTATNAAGECSSNNASGDCLYDNSTGDCSYSNEAGSEKTSCESGQNTCGATDTCGEGQLDCGQSGCYSDADCGGCDTDDSSCGGCFGCDSCEADDCGSCDSDDSCTGCEATELGGE